MVRSKDGTWTHVIIRSRRTNGTGLERNVIRRINKVLDNALALEAGGGCGVEDL